VVRVSISENKYDGHRTGLACIKSYNFVGSTYMGLGTVFISMNYGGSQRCNIHMKVFRQRLTEKSIMSYLLSLFVDVVPFQTDQWRVTVEVKCTFLLTSIGSIAEFGTSGKI